MRWKSLRLIVFLILGGLTTFGMGYREWILYRRADAEPQMMSLRELEENGPGGNIFLFVTDVFPCIHSYVYQAEGNTRVAVWIPATPLDGAYHRMVADMYSRRQSSDTLLDIPPPRDIKVLIKLNRDNVDLLSDDLLEDTARGLVLNDIETLDREVAELLEEAYPGINFENCWIIELNREPVGPGRLLLLFGASVAFLLIGIWALVRFFVAPPSAPDEVSPWSPENFRG